MLDVVVVGAGPTGSRTAYSLALQGHSVTVLEKRSNVGLKSCCTGIISQECLTKFDIPLEVVWWQIYSSRLFSPSGESLCIARPEVQAHVLNRSAFDRHLARLASERGVNYQFNSSVEAIYFHADQAVLQVSSQGVGREIAAKAVVLACGFTSPLIRTTGLGQSRFFTTGVQTEVQTKNLKEVEIYFGSQVAPGFFAWLVPTQSNRALAGLMTCKSAGSYLRNWLSDLVAQGKIESGIHNICCSGIPMYPLKRTYRDRLLVVGDAAGQVKPTTGGGIYFGLLCADIASNTLHNGLNSGNLSASYLSGYQRDWNKLLKRELHYEYLARRVYQKLSDSRIDKIFAAAKSEGWIDRVLKKDEVGFDWHGQVLSRMIGKGLLAMLSAKLRK